MGRCRGLTSRGSRFIRRDWLHRSVSDCGAKTRDASALISRSARLIRPVRLNHAERRGPEGGGGCTTILILESPRALLIRRVARLVSVYFRQASVRNVLMSLFCSLG